MQEFELLREQVKCLYGIHRKLEAVFGAHTEICMRLFAVCDEIEVQLINLEKNFQEEKRRELEKARDNVGSILKTMLENIKEKLGDDEH